MHTHTLSNTMGVTGGVGGFSPALGCDQCAPVTGIAFNDDRPGGSLLISTDKHIVSLPLDQHAPKGGEEDGRKQKRSAWDGRSVRRLEFGSPLTMTRDPNTGLLFMTIKAPPPGRSAGKLSPDILVPAKSMKLKGGAEVSGSSGADSLAIVAARHRPMKPDKLSLSAAQLYQDHTGAVSGVVACSPCGRVVSFDDNGCLIIWKLLADKVMLFYFKHD
jgi:hypothetical protein